MTDTTTTTTSPPWLDYDQLTPPAVRSEVAALVEALHRITREAGPTIVGAIDLAVQLDETRRAASTWCSSVLEEEGYDPSSPEQGLHDFVSAAIGLTALFHAVDDLHQLADIDRALVEAAGVER